ncbi:MAG: arylsulfatase [Planctomycetaceae bacterium]|nr:arylsulfatase [Planctomycetaceae bacterium]
MLILADDMGHGHVSRLNPQAKFQTPHIDRLASQGVTLTDAHSGSAVCSPTRYGLLTGRYAWRTKLVSGVLKPYDPPLIEANRLTLPALLKQHGYHTACVGKWHLGWDWQLPQNGGEPDFRQPIAGGPTTRGFDHYFGTDVPNYPPYCYIENDRTLGLPTAHKEQVRLEGRAGAMLPGWKFDAILPGLVERGERYIASRAATREPFFLYMPLTSPHEPINPSAEFRGKSGLGALADFILETDAVVGRIAAAIERAGIADNTLFIFTADNGSSTYAGGDELIRLGHAPSAKFRGFKASIYEGGHRVPFMARWPGQIAAGSTSTETICLTDMLATMAQVVGAKLPDDAGEDSYNVLGALRGESHSMPIREATVHQSAAGQLAIRQGRWKLIVPLGPERKPILDDPTQATLYDLEADPVEQHDRAAAEPEVVARLTKLLDQYRRTGRSHPPREG